MPQEDQALADEIGNGLTAQDVADLRRPFAVEAIGLKIQVSPKEGKNGMVVAHHDARLVGERLNAVVPDLWSMAFKAVPSGAVNANAVICRLKVGNCTREDVGYAEDTASDMGIKALYSDAFKRVAVHFGVGAHLYTLPKMYAPEGPNALKAAGRSHYIQPELERRLRSQMAAHFEGTANVFGKPLGHGDAPDAQAVAPDTSPPPVTDTHPYGPPADEKLESSLLNGLAYLVSTGDQDDTDTARKVVEEIVAKQGYIAEAVAKGILFTAMALKNKVEAAAPAGEE